MFTVVIPVLNQFDELKKCLTSWFEFSKGCFELILIDNGSSEELSDQQFVREWISENDISIYRNSKNTGVYPTFQQGYDLVKAYSRSRYIFFSHSDVEMKEYGWDDKLRRLLKQIESRERIPGVCGMFGAKGIGTPDIYKAPYDFRQLMRWDCVTVQSMLGAGARLIKSEYERVAVLDGFSLIVSKEMVKSVLSETFDIIRYPVHHCYDTDLCCDSHLNGYSNYVLDIDCIHHGGVTSTREKWAEVMGTTDISTHRKAHEVMYAKFRGRLPIGVR